MFKPDVTQADLGRATVNPPRPRGFAAMTPERRSEISRMGGAAVPADKRSFSKDRELAAIAGAVGGSSRATNASAA